jgi:cbb3-type cytochrome oxidase subunit 1
MAWIELAKGIDGIGWCGMALEGVAWRGVAWRGVVSAQFQMSCLPSCAFYKVRFVTCSHYLTGRIKLGLNYHTNQLKFGSSKDLEFSRNIT